jgi:hypothetical protein
MKKAVSKLEFEYSNKTIPVISGNTSVVYSFPQ